MRGTSRTEKRESGGGDLLDHLVAEDVVAVEHLDGACGPAARVARDLDLGEAAFPDGLAQLVPPHGPRRRRRPPLPLRPRRRCCLRHPPSLPFPSVVVVTDRWIDRADRGIDNG